MLRMDCPRADAAAWKAEKQPLRPAESSRWRLGQYGAAQNRREGLRKTIDGRDCDGLTGYSGLGQQINDERWGQKGKIDGHENRILRSSGCKGSADAGEGAEARQRIFYNRCEFGERW